MAFSASHRLVLGTLVAGGLLLSPLASDIPTTEPAVSTAEGREAVVGEGLQPSTTLDDQVDLALTIYNSNIALVRDVRELTLPVGPFDLTTSTSPRPSIRRRCTSGRSRSPGC